METHMKKFLVTFLSTVTLFLASPLNSALAAPKTNQNPNQYNQEQPQQVLRGNYSSHIYHNSYCKHYKCKKCTVILKSTKDAQEKGYRPCKVCGG